VGAGAIRNRTWRPSALGVLLGCELFDICLAVSCLSGLDPGAQLNDELVPPRAVVFHSRPFPMVKVVRKKFTS